MNRIRPTKKEPTTSDHDIQSRQWLLIDCDPIRPAGISSSDSEHDTAIQRARDIAEYLSFEGWPDPIIGDSGNGGHLLYPIDQRVDDGGLHERCLASLQNKFGNEAVTIDQTTKNPARIWRPYGMLNGKGDAAAAEIGRPHRMAKLLSVPEVLP